MCAAANHEVGSKADARRHIPAGSHFLHAKLLGKRLEKPVSFRRQIHHELAAVAHPGHKVGRALPQARQVAHREDDLFIPFQVRQLLFGQVDQVGLDACLIEHRLDVFECAGRRHLARVVQRQTPRGGHMASLGNLRGIEQVERAGMAHAHLVALLKDKDGGHEHKRHKDADELAIAQPSALNLLHGRPSSNTRCRAYHGRSP